MKIWTHLNSKVAPGTAPDEFITRGEAIEKFSSNTLYFDYVFTSIESRDAYFQLNPIEEGITCLINGAPPATGWTYKGPELYDNTKWIEINITQTVVGQKINTREIDYNEWINLTPDDLEEDVLYVIVNAPDNAVNNVITFDKDDWSDTNTANIPFLTREGDKLVAIKGSEDELIEDNVLCIKNGIIASSAVKEDTLVTAGVIADGSIPFITKENDINILHDSAVQYDELVTNDVAIIPNELVSVNDNKIVGLTLTVDDIQYEDTVAGIITFKDVMDNTAGNDHMLLSDVDVTTANQSFNIPSDKVNIKYEYTSLLDGGTSTSNIILNSETVNISPIPAGADNRIAIEYSPKIKECTLSEVHPDISDVKVQGGSNGSVFFASLEFTNNNNIPLDTVVLAVTPGPTYGSFYDAEAKTNVSGLLLEIVPGTGPNKTAKVYTRNPLPQGKHRANFTSVEGSK